MRCTCVHAPAWWLLAGVEALINPTPHSMLHPSRAAGTCHSSIHSPSSACRAHCAALTQVVAYDYGIKLNILRRLAAFGCRITVVPATYPASDVLKMNPDGVFFSNGPVSAPRHAHGCRAARMPWHAYIGACRPANSDATLYLQRPRKACPQHMHAWSAASGCTITAAVRRLPARLRHAPVAESSPPRPCRGGGNRTC